MPPRANDSMDDCDDALQRLCDQFQRECESQETPPSIEEVLLLVSSGSRKELLLKLLGIDLAIRRKRGDRPRMSDYLARFPELDEFISAHDFSPLMTSKLESVSEGPVLISWEGGSLSVQGVPSVPHLPGYEILEEIGRGGMGVVYKARQIGLKRIVAVKMILAGAHATSETIARFRAEAESVARLRHAGIVQVHEIGEWQGLPYFTLEFVEGGTLKKLLANNPLPPRDAAVMTRSLAKAVQAAHAANIIHRDLTPGNILVAGEDEPDSDLPPDSTAPFTSTTPGVSSRIRLKIADFGLAKQLDVLDKRTISGDVFGTPSYMSPEQVEGRVDAIGPATDIYALGVILYEMLTGRPPFKASGLAETFALIRNEEPVAPRVLQPGTPRDLETICLKCLRKERAKRYASASELAADLDRFLDGIPIHARQISTLEVALRWCQRKPALAALIAVAALLICVFLPLLVTYRVQATTSDTAAKTQKYFSIVHGVINRNRERPLGWVDTSLNELRDATLLNTTSKDALELRNLAAECLGGFDLRESGTFAEQESNSLVAISPDGKTLATSPNRAPRLCHIKVFDVESRELLKELPFSPDLNYELMKERPNGPRTMAFSPDGQYLFVGARNGTLHSWDLHDDFRETSWPAHPMSPIVGLAFADDAKTIYTGGGSQLKAWIVGQPGVEKSPCQTVRSDIKGLFMDRRDGGWLATVDEYGWVTGIFDTRSLEPVPNQDQAEVASGELPCVSHCGRFAAFARGARVYIRPISNAAAPARQMSEDGISLSHNSDIDGLAFSPDSSLLATSCGGDDDRMLKIWEVASSRLLTSVNMGGVGNEIRLAFHPDGRSIFVAGDRKVLAYEIRGLSTATYTAIEPDPISWAHLIHQGRQLVVMSCRHGAGPKANFDFSRWSPDERLPLHIHSGGENAWTKSFAAARETTDFAFYRPKEIELSEVQGCSRKMAAPDLQRLTYHPRGTSLWSVQDSRSLVGSDATDFKEFFRWTLPLGPDGRSSLNAMAVSENLVAVGTREGGCRLFDQTRPKPLYQWSGMPGSVEALAMDDQETMVAFGCTGGAIQLRSAVDGTLVAEPGGHNKAITSLALGNAPDGMYLASASRDKTIRLWRIRDGVCEHVLTLRFDRSVLQIQFDNESSRLYVLCESEHAVRVWNLGILRQGLAKLGLDWN
jgi:serine/threonine protein kinase